MWNRFKGFVIWILSWLFPSPQVIYAGVLAMIPTAVAALAFVQGYMQEMPWMWVIMATSLTFAAATHAYLILSIWRDRRNPANKLVFSNLRYLKTVNAPQWSLGFAVQNSSTFPIEAELCQIATKIVDRVPLKTISTGQILFIPAGGQGWFDDFAIEVPTTPKTPIDGTLEATIKYGHPGKRKFEMKLRKWVTAASDEEGNFLGWNAYEAQ